MQWDLTDEQQMFAEALREWISARFPLGEADAVTDTGTFTSALLADGWWGVGHPEDDGGQGGAFLETALASVEFGRGAASNATWLAAQLVLPALAGEESRAVLEGTTRAVLAVRSDRVPAITDVRFDGAAVSGTVPHVLGAGDAGVFVIPVGTADGPALVRVEAEGVGVTADPLLDRSRRTAAVTFDGAPAALLDGDAEQLLAQAAVRAAVLVAADSLGAARRMLDLSVEYSKQRKQFGRLIGEFQAVKHACAQMLVTVEAAHSIALYAAAALDSGASDAGVAAAVAKAQVTDSAACLADSALTVHGAIGYTWEHELHLHYKRVRLNRVLFGSPQVWNEQVADAVLAAARARVLVDAG